MPTFEGDPSRLGPYAVLMRLDGGAWIPVHFHNVAKRVVVISGILLMCHEAAGAATTTHRLTAGGVCHCAAGPSTRGGS